jgi:hypothetical protein
MSTEIKRFGWTRKGMSTMFTSASLKFAPPQEGFSVVRKQRPLCLSMTSLQTLCRLWLRGWNKRELRLNLDQTLQLPRAVRHKFDCDTRESIGLRRLRADNGDIRKTHDLDTTVFDMIRTDQRLDLFKGGRSRGETGDNSRPG